MIMRLTPPIRFLASIVFLWIGVRIFFWAPLGIAPPDFAFPGEFVLSSPRIAAAPDPMTESTTPPAMPGAAETAFARGVAGLPPRPPLAPSPYRPAIDRSAAAFAPLASADRTPPSHHPLFWFAGFAPSTFHPLLLRARSSTVAMQAGGDMFARTPRWAWSSWALWRSGRGTNPLARGGALGGSQAGFSARYRVMRSGGLRLALAGRLSRPLETRNGSEAAIGLAARPAAAVPVELTLERRIGLDSGGRNAWSLGLAGGVDRLRMPLDFELNAYGQAGIVGARRRDLYAEATLAVERPIVQAGRSSLAIGGGSWASAQPGVARLDIGPQATLRVPAGDGSIRLAVGWRQRIAGNASPGSGPVVTLGTDF